MSPKSDVLDRKKSGNFQTAKISSQHCSQGEHHTSFADTGANISVMSVKSAQSIKLLLTRTKIKILPYGSKPLKSLSYYDGTVMCGTTVANICLHVIKPNVKIFLSGKICEELGIITFNSRPPNTSDQRVCSIDPDNYKATLVTNFPNAFHGIGKLNNFTVEFHIDKNILPIASPAHPIPFHLQDRFKSEIAKMKAAGIIEEHTGPGYQILSYPLKMTGVYVLQLT